MTADDALLSFALAEYLSTAFPKQTPGLLKMHGKGTSMNDALAKHLGMTFPEFEKRFQRWLREH